MVTDTHLLWLQALYLAGQRREAAAVQLPQIPNPQRQLVRLFVLASLATVPDHLHRLLAPTERRLEELAAAQVVQGPLALLQALFGPSDSIAVATRRAAAPVAVG